MPLKKKGSRKNIGKLNQKKALIPTKQDLYTTKKVIIEKTTQVPKNRRVTAEATSGKRKRSK